MTVTWGLLHVLHMYLGTWNVHRSKLTDEVRLNNLPIRTDVPVCTALHGFWKNSFVHAIRTYICAEKNLIIFSTIIQMSAWIQIKLQKWRAQIKVSYRLVNTDKAQPQNKNSSRYVTAFPVFAISGKNTFLNWKLKFGVLKMRASAVIFKKLP
jgi:hypothetical protein